MDAAEGKLPASISLSMALHAGALGLWIYFNQLPKPQQTRILTNVELMVMQHPSASPTLAEPRAAARPDTWNFLKMALPSIPKPLDVETPKAEPKPKLEPMKVLQENRQRKMPSLESLAEKDAGHRPAPMPSLEDAGLKESHSRPRLAEAPRLEEVGAHRASKSLLAAATLEEERQRAPRPQGLEALAAADEPRPSHATAAPMAALPAEASAPRPSSLSRLSSLLPAEQPIGQGDGRGGPLLKPEMDMPAPEKHEAQAMTEHKKATTIEGPLKGRKILHAEIPKFPAWAQAQGVLEASVRIRFNVDPSGKVQDDIQLVETSGYGELDRLAMDSLRAWTFQPIDDSAGVQWGIITFRFVME